MIRAVYNYFDFIQALSKAVQPELSLFHVLQSNQHFFYFYRNWVKSVTNQDQIVTTNFFLDVIIIYIVIEYIIYYFCILIQIPFQVLNQQLCVL